MSSRIRNFGPIRVDDLTTVKAFLAAEIPVVVGFQAYDEWFDLDKSDPFYDTVVGAPREHVVLAVGYDDELAVVKVFNSDGQLFGDNGFAFITYELWPQVVLLGYVTEDEVDEPGLSFRAPAHVELNRVLVVQSGDLDGDGDTDLAIITRVSGEFDTLEVLLNEGDGAFARRTIGSTGGFPSSDILLADLDGDGDLDVAVPGGRGSVTDFVRIFLNNGDATFAVPQDYDTGQDLTFSIAAGDVDGDADLDVSVGINSEVARHVPLLLNNGDGTFSSPTQLLVGFVPLWVEMGDLNKDGGADLAVSRGYTTGAVTVRLSNGDGTFADPTDHVSGDNPRVLTMGDLDNDQDLDLATINFGGPDSTVSILLNNGDGTFGRAVDYPALPRFRSTAFFGTLGDPDGDGDLDIGIVGKSTDPPIILCNNGDGTFANPLAFGTALQPGFLTFGDFNNDGREDIAVADSFAERVSILINRSGR